MKSVPSTLYSGPRRVKGDMGCCEILELFPTRRRDRALFTELPFRLAGGYPAWQPGVRKLARDLINPEKNPYWHGRNASFFVVRRDREIIGRIAVLGPGEVPQRPDAAVLMFPDFIDDAGIVDMLIGCACNRARESGATELIGPMNPNIHHDVGIQVSGFEHRNAVFMGYHPAYYSKRLEAQGFVPLHDFQAWSLFENTFRRDGQIRKLAERVLRGSALRIRSGDLSRFDQELQIFHRLYAEAFADHWGFVPPTWEEFRFLAADLRRVLRPNMALIAEWNGEPVGFVLSLPDLYSILPKNSSGHLTPGFVFHAMRGWRHVELVRVMIAGVLPSHRSHGIHLPLFYRIACEIFDLGFRGGEISWVIESNRAMTRALELLGATPTKAYRMYSKGVNP